MGTKVTKVDSASKVMSVDPVKKNAGEKKEDINFSSSKTTDYETNTKSNLFLKEYIEGKAASQGVKIPDGMKINISSFKMDKNARWSLSKIEYQKYWEDFVIWCKNRLPGNDIDYKSVEQYCDDKGITGKDKEKILEIYLFNDVRVNIYKSRIGDMFKLLGKDKNTVEAKVSEMKISDEDKSKIIKLKEFFDKYYKVEAEYNGKTYNLLNLSENDKQELATISPEFAKFIEKEQPELKKHTLDFAGKELKAKELDDAASVSKGGAVVVGGMLAFNVVKGVYDSKQVKKSLVKSKEFIEYTKTNPNEADAIIKEATRRYNRVNGGERGLKLAGRYMKKVGFEGGEHFIAQKAIFKAGMPKWINPLKAFKHAKGGALIGLLATTIQGAGDDCMGAGKDYMQDQNNFGTPTALGIAAASMAAGVGSSAAIAPTVNGIVDYNRAEKALVKNGLAEKAKGLARWKKLGKLGVIGALFGMVIASSSSGSSWTSMIGTGLKMKLNGNELEEKGIIAKEDNTHSSNFDNMMEYEAYKGKLNGITFGDTDSGVLTGDWTIGSVGGGFGLFTHTNPYIQSMSFGLQGCSETLTACGYQLAGSTIRDNQIDKDKQKLVDSAKIK